MLLLSTFSLAKEARWLVRCAPKRSGAAPCGTVLGEAPLSSSGRWGRDGSSVTCDREAGVDMVARAPPSG